jgi:hypothetical protein
VTVRDATSADATALAAIHVDTWRLAYRDQIPGPILDSLDVSQRMQFWSGVLSQDHTVFVAVIDSAMVGFCSLIPYAVPSLRVLRGLIHGRS